MKIHLPAIARAFGHRNYRLFYAGQLISLCGTWMQVVAQSWLIYRLTGSALLLGLVSFSSQIPMLIMSPLGGATADRFEKRKILLATQTTSMVLSLLLAGLTLAGHIKVWEIVVIAAIMGAIHAFDMPARHAFVVEMVGKKDLVNAIALNSSMFNAARVLGPSIGGVIVASFGEGWCFLLNGLSFCTMIAALLMMHFAPQKSQRHHETALSSILSGFVFSWNTLPIRSLLILLAVVSLLGMPYTVLMPIFAREILGGGPQTLGILMGSVGVGAFTGALVLAARKEVHGLGQWIMLSAAGFGISLLFFSFSTNIWLSAALLFPAGFFFIGQMASSNTLIQTIVPDRLRGRAMSVYSMMFVGIAPFGSLMAGACAEHLGAPATVAICGLACILASVLFGLGLSKFSHTARQMIVDAEAASGTPAEE